MVIRQWCMPCGAEVRELEATMERLNQFHAFLQDFLGVAEVEGANDMASPRQLEVRQTALMC